MKESRTKFGQTTQSMYKSRQWEEKKQNHERKKGKGGNCDQYPPRRIHPPRKKKEGEKRLLYPNLVLDPNDNDIRILCTDSIKKCFNKLNVAHTGIAP